MDGCRRAEKSRSDPKTYTDGHEILLVARISENASVNTWILPMPSHRSARPPVVVSLVCLIATSLVSAASQSPAVRTYFPARGEWRKQDPTAVGVDKVRLDEAIAFAIAHENPDT